MLMYSLILVIKIGIKEQWLPHSQRVSKIGLTWKTAVKEKECIGYFINHDSVKRFMSLYVSK